MELTREEIAKRKAEILITLAEVEQEARRLLDRVDRAKRMINYVRNMADVEEYDRDYGDLEEGFSHITLS